MENLVIRPMEQRDSRDMAHIRRMQHVIETTNGLPSDNDSYYENRIANVNPLSHQFVAVINNNTVEEKVIGWCGLFVGSARQRHTGSLGIFVHADYQGMGVGKALLSTVLDLADNWLMLHRVELDFFAGNTNAQKLYERFGFEIEGVKRDASISMGEYKDLVLMGRIKQ